MLPTDQWVQDLQPRQIDWIMENLDNDAAILAKAAKRGAGTKTFGGV